MLTIYVRDSRRWIENVTILQSGDLQDWELCFLTIRKFYFDIREVDNFAQVYTKYID
jgi:hypothetical protein